MNNTTKDPTLEDGLTLPGRRQMLKSGVALAAVSLLPRNITPAQAQTGQSTTKSHASTTLDGRRRLGQLAVSSIGPGVQNMSRTYQTTIPTRAEMLNIYQDHGVYS